MCTTHVFQDDLYFKHEATKQTFLNFSDVNNVAHSSCTTGRCLRVFVAVYCVCYGLAPFQELRRQAFSYQQGRRYLRASPNIYVENHQFGPPSLPFGHRTRPVVRSYHITIHIHTRVSPPLQQKKRGRDTCECMSPFGRIVARVEVGLIYSRFYACRRHVLGPCSI